MRVRAYAIDQDTGAETYTATDFLSEFIDQSDDEYAEAVNALSKMGRFYVGGGAAQLFLLFRVKEG